MRKRPKMYGRIHRRENYVGTYHRAANYFFDGHKFDMSSVRFKMLIFGCLI
jgi:hypothetical protein